MIPEQKKNQDNTHDPSFILPQPQQYDKNTERKNNVSGTPHAECQVNYLTSDDFQGELIKRVILSIQRQLPNYSLQSSISALNHYFYPKQKGKPQQQTSTQVQHVQAHSKIFKQVSETSQYRYLLDQALPKVWRQGIPPYDPVESPFFDVIAYNTDQKTQLDVLKMQEQRFAANIYCSKGYGISLFRDEIKGTECNFSKDRYKSLIGATVRLAFRQIEHFLQFKMKRDTSALRRIEVKAMLTPILNIRSEFEQRHQETFFRCMKTAYRIKTQLALDQDVLDFYRAAVDKIRGREYVGIVDRELSREEEDKIDLKMFENNTLWTPQLERQFAQIYLRRKCLSGIKAELEARYPKIDSHHFEQSRLRARSDRIFAVATRKANIVLEKWDKREEMLVITDRLKKIISRSPVASLIRDDLCHIFLQQDIDLDCAVSVLRSIKAIGLQMQSSFYQSNQSDAKVKLEEQAKTPGSVKVEQGWPLPRTRGRKRRTSYQYAQKRNQVSLRSQSSTDSSTSQKNASIVKLQEPYMNNLNSRRGFLAPVKEQTPDIFYSSDEEDTKPNELEYYNQLISETVKELETEQS